MVKGTSLSQRQGRWILVLLLGLCWQAASASEPVRVGLFDMPPYYSQRDDGAPQGYLIDTLNHVMTQLNYNWEPRFASVNDTLRDVTTGELDLVMLIRHPLLEGQALYGHQPIDYMVLNTYRTNSAIRCSNLAGMRNLRVVLLKGYGYGGLLNQLINPSNGLLIRIADTHRQAFEMLAKGDVDCVLDYERPASKTIAELGLSDLHRQMLHSQPIYFVTSRKAQAERQLLDALNAVTVGLN